MRGFTLVEVLIVVIILGILATIVVPQFADASHDANSATLRTILASVQERIDYEYHRATPPSYPATIDPAWFAGGTGLRHPENQFNVPAVEIVDQTGTLHPANKTLQAGVAGAFWYNRAEGVFRARVASQGTSAATLIYYNQVNGSAETTIDDADNNDNPWGS